MEEDEIPATKSWQQRLADRGRAGPWPLFAGAGLMLLLLWAWSAAAPDSFKNQFDALTSVDIEQGRIDTALPAPQGDLALVQTFVPRHNGLTEVEVTLLRYDDADPEDDALLLLQLLDDQGELVAEKTLSSRSIVHNQVERLLFTPDDDSEGQLYRIRLSGSTDNRASVWGYALDVYSEGALVQEGAQNTVLPAQDLRFVTRYRLTWGDALLLVGQTIFYEGLLFILALLVIPLPGVLLLLAEHAYRQRQISGLADSRRQPWDPAAWWGAAIALGVSSWPVLWLWLTMIGGRWTAGALGFIVFMGWAAAVAYWWTIRRSHLTGGQSPADVSVVPPITSPWRWDHLLLLAILLVGLAVRLVAVRDTPVLPWVDASRHALITAVMAENGQTVSSYAPYLDVERFPYHFGFHTLSSSLLLLSDWPLERLLLYLGQLLNALVALTVYAAVWLLIGSRRAGYLAAFLVALPFFFPAYYATWGRLTQLTAVLLLPILIAFAWQITRGDAAWHDRWWLTGVLAAGLFLVHFRVFIYFLPFPFIVLLLSRLRGMRWLGAAAILGFILALPRMFALLNDTNPLQRLGRTIPDYNNFPMNYLTTGWERAFLIAAALALLLVLFAAVRRRAWITLPLALALWVAALFALLSLDLLGITVPSVVNLNSMYITLFIPLALFLAVVSEQIWLWLEKQRWPLRLALGGLAGAVIAAMLVFGVRRQVSILNQQTLLTQFEDIAALQWLDKNAPDDALVATNSWRWLGQTWAVSDGGAWILPLTARSVTTPPIDYVYDRQIFMQVQTFNEAAMAVSDWSDPLQAAWLREQGVSHVFVGKRGGFFDPTKLALNPELDLVFDHDGVFIFTVRN